MSSAGLAVKVRASSPWAPLRIGVFRALWIASVVSNVGSWMHLVAASWLMTSLTSSAAPVALLSTASALPSFALALPAGALADMLDRRRLILFTQAWQLAVAAILGVLTLYHITNPAVLLGATVVLGVGTTLGMPAFSAITPELVSGEELPAAISLNSVAVTSSQMIGPAIGGVMVAWIGSGGVFLLNAASFLSVLAVVYAWRRAKVLSTLPPEHLSSAIRSGMRYVGNAPELRAVLVRAAAFVACYSALPALLAVITRTRLHETASVYGILLGGLGIGGVVGALVLPRIRGRLTPDQITMVFSALYAVCLVTLARLHTFQAAFVVLFFAGLAGMGVMSSLSIAAQSVLPAWIRGRGLAIFQLVFQVGFAAGAAVWGVLANGRGLTTALTVAGIALVVQMVLGIRYRLTAAEDVDVELVGQMEPYVPVSLAPDDGPIMLTVEYRIPAEHLDEFLGHAAELGRARRRDGAMHWGFYSDPEDPERHVETFVASSWSEHLRQSQRLTGADAAAIARVRALHMGEADPPVKALISDRLKTRT
ncbi:MFS family permease [Catenulispora sp. GAS73]|uniref:MFS transporter n=1 Tax=Catenulispora sp. GAS73 TaxID=3156269 RepID=UPI0035111D1D